MKTAIDGVRWATLAACVAVVGILWPAQALAQATGPGVIRACYNKAGAVYRIGVPGTPSSCRGNDTEFSWNALGEKGDKGDTGDAGLSCWDLNGNGVQDAAEDVNTDGSFDALDCQGPTGPQGPQGPPGPAGALGAVSFVTATNQIRPPTSFATLLTTSFTTTSAGPGLVSFYANSAKLDGASEHTGLLFRLMVDGTEVVSGNRIRNDHESPFRDAQMYGFNWVVDLAAGSHTIAVEWVGLCDSGFTGCATMDSRSLIVQHAN